MVNETKIRLPKGYEPTEVITHPFIEGKLYMKKMTVPKGMFVQAHVHKFDHYSILSKGKAKILVGEQNIEAFKDGKEYEYEQAEAGDHLLIKAKEYHAIIFDEDSVWTCIHVTDTEQDDIDKDLVSDEVS